MADGKAVDVLYKLMRHCNRSLPHMELLKYSLCILLNLSKVGKLIRSTVVHTVLVTLQLYWLVCVTCVYTSVCPLSFVHICFSSCTCRTSA